MSGSQETRISFPEKQVLFTNTFLERSSCLEGPHKTLDWNKTIPVQIILGVLMGGDVFILVYLFIITVKLKYCVSFKLDFF